MDHHPEEVLWVSLPDLPEQWVLSPFAGLKFIRDEYGRAILHQAWTSDGGNCEWRPVPMEEA